MQIYLDGIGLIKDSAVKLDGLTVITGENNSGKSTVGKALYAIVDGMIDIDLKQDREEFSYVRRKLMSKLRNLIRNIDRLHPDNEGDNEDDRYDEEDENQVSLTAMEQILSGNYVVMNNSKKKLASFVEEINEELQNYEPSTETIRYFEALQSFTQKDQFQVFNELKSEALEQCNKILDLLNNGISTHEFRSTYLNHIISSEFKSEVQPVKKQEGIATVTFSDEQGVLFETKIEKNSIIQESFTAIADVFSKSYLIDNAFILDEVPSSRGNRYVGYMFDDDGDESIINKANIITHKEKLINYLSAPYRADVLNELANREQYITVLKKINAILPGSFRLTARGLDYIEDGIPIKASNLATGSKMFGIIKMILDRYGLDDNTMLILDEPEAHLHPKWQNAFAEVIVILVKELGVNVLLTSHSPNFVLAIDAFMRKYEINEKTNFYKTDIQEDGFVKYKLVNDDLSVIYDDFARYFAKVRTMRDHEFFGVDE